MVRPALASPACCSTAKDTRYRQAARLASASTRGWSAGAVVLHCSGSVRRVPWMKCMRVAMRWLSVTLLCIAPASALAQQQPVQQAPAPPPAQQQAAPPPQPSGPAWSQLPRMQLERQFAGPLQDTLIQRWRDPVDGTVCYIYLPITASHSTPTPSGYVQYGPNTIGSISCLAGGRPPPPQAKSGPTPTPIQPR